MKKNLLFISVMAFTLLTQAQVSLVKDISPGSFDGIESGSQLFAFNNKILFSGGIIGGTGYELWSSDGTASGTILIKDISSWSSSPREFYYWDVTGKVYFSADTASPTYPDRELWETDGTESGTNLYRTFNVLSGNIDSSSYPSFINSLGNRLIFTALFRNGSNNFARELCFADNTPSAVLPNASTGYFIKDINPDLNGNSYPNELTLFNNELYFAANNGSVNGRELWKTNGFDSGTIMIADIAPGSPHSSPENLTIFNNKIYFSADDGTNGTELWVSDGTTVGTTRVFNSIPVAADLKNPENLIVFNNALYFTATHPTLGVELFKLAGSSITNPKNIATGGGNSNPSNLFVFDNKLYFSADDNTNGIELWSSGGFSSNTNMVKDINTSPSTPDSNPSGFTEYNGKLYFSANNDTNGRELWVTDGTPAGTVLVDDINTSGDSNPENLTVAGDNLFFSATTPATGKELFKYSSNPQIVALDPVDDAINVAIDKRLTITFNKAIVANTGNVTIYDASDDSVVETIDILSSSISITGNEILIEPSSDFVLAKQYYIQVDNGAIKGSDNSVFTGIFDKTTWNFETIGLQNQTITFNALPNKTFGDADFNLTATASSNLAVSYISSNTNVATITGNTVTILQAGGVTITASQAGNTNYNPAPDVSRYFVIDKANQTLSFVGGAFSTKTYGDPIFTINAASSANLTITEPLTSSNLNVATIVNGTTTSVVTIVGAGTTAITTTHSGNNQYNAASITQNLTVLKANQAITFNPLPDVAVNDPDFNLAAASNSGLPLTYTSSNPSVASVSGNVVSINAVGSTVITASQTGNTNYNSATAVSQSLTVSTGLSTDDFNKLGFNIYPNPVSNYFKIESKETLSNVEVYSIQGQSIKSFIPQNKYDISDLSTGIYFVKIKANNKESTKRIIKQ